MDLKRFLHRYVGVRKLSREVPGQKAVFFGQTFTAIDLMGQVWWVYFWGKLHGGRPALSVTLET